MFLRRDRDLSIYFRGTSIIIIIIIFLLIKKSFWGNGGPWSLPVPPSLHLCRPRAPPPSLLVSPLPNLSFIGLALNFKLLSNRSVDLYRNPLSFSCLCYVQRESRDPHFYIHFKVGRHITSSEVVN